MPDVVTSIIEHSGTPGDIIVVETNTVIVDIAVISEGKDAILIVDSLAAFTIIPLIFLLFPLSSQCLHVHDSHPVPCSVCI